MPFEMKWTERKKKEIPKSAIIWLWNSFTEEVEIHQTTPTSVWAKHYTQWQFTYRVKPYGPSGKPLTKEQYWLQQMADECELRHINKGREADGLEPLTAYGSFDMDDDEEEED